MGFHRATAVALATGLLAACGGDGSGGVDVLIIVPDAPPPDSPPPVDAPGPNLACVNDPAPATGPNPLAVSGSASDINIVSQMTVPVAGATLQAFRIGQAQAVANSTSDANGNWTLSIPNPATTAVDGYIRASKTGNRTVYLYPPGPMAADIAMAPLLLFSNTTFSTIVAIAQVSQAASNGTVGLAIVDCNNMPLPGATIAVQQGGANVGQFFDAGTLLPGGSFTFDVPPGPTDIKVSYNGTNFRARVVETVAGSTTTTIVRPGY